MADSNMSPIVFAERFLRADPYRTYPTKYRTVPCYHPRPTSFDGGVPRALSAEAEVVKLELYRFEGQTYAVGQCSCGKTYYEEPAS